MAHDRKVFVVGRRLCDGSSSKPMGVAVSPQLFLRAALGSRLPVGLKAARLFVWAELAILITDDAPPI
jgi:hypothetical protein